MSEHDNRFLHLTSPSAPAAAPPTRPAAPIGMLDLVELPDTYGIDEVSVLPRDPYTQLAYWEATPHGRAGGLVHVDVEVEGGLVSRSGDLAIVLHAHLPYVRHPEHAYHLEENWLYEAITATYLPLLEVWRGLVRDGIDFRVTMSMSPPLVTMLRDDVLKLRYGAYLDRLIRLGDDERHRTAGDPAFHPL